MIKLKPISKNQFKREILLSKTSVRWMIWYAMNKINGISYFHYFNQSQNCGVCFIINKESVYTVVEKMPEFSGGYSKMLEYLNNNIKIPQSYFDNGVIGKFFFEFVVEKDGSISKLKLINDDNFKLHKIVASAFINMPKWIPGKQNGEAVRVKMVFPIHIN